MAIVQEGGQRVGAKAEDSTLAELRKSVSEISKELSTIVERRSRALREGTEAGTAAVRKTIRRQPLLAMGIATVAGAVIALALVPRFGGHKPAVRRHWDGWMPQVTRADLHDLADNLQRSISRAAHSAPVTSSVERLMDALSRVEPSSSLNAVVDKVGSWLKRAPDAVMPTKK